MEFHIEPVKGCGCLELVLYAVRELAQHHLNLSILCSAELNTQEELREKWVRVWQDILKVHYVVRIAEFINNVVGTRKITNQC